MFIITPIKRKRKTMLKKSVIAHQERHSDKIHFTSQRNLYIIPLYPFGDSQRKATGWKARLELDKGIKVRTK